MRRLRRLRYFRLLFALVALATISGCGRTTSSAPVKGMSQFDIRLTDIGFGHNTALLSPDTLYVPGERLPFRVDVSPKDTFTGQPFRTVQLGNRDIGYQTLVQSTPAVWLALLSRDGYFFSSAGPLTWTPEELQLPDALERDYYKIQSIKERRVKHVTIYAPSSDKATLASYKTATGYWQNYSKNSGIGL